ncbi:transposase [Viridibacillus sp. YIM B01967]|uniref:Transposase n=1 Tax=Viridibacillus soli TaxID=2798301 RepID=A0ABS1H6R2_9BACL|nr:transposase [Viridibacillus soli]
MTQKSTTIPRQHRTSNGSTVQKWKTRVEIVREYGLSPSILDNWTKKHRNSDSFLAKESRIDAENELFKLCKENQRLMRENDILKQTTLIK